MIIGFSFLSHTFSYLKIFFSVQCFCNEKIRLRKGRLSNSLSKLQTLLIHGFRICEFTYLLRLLGPSESVAGGISGALQTCTGSKRGLSCPFPALLSGFSHAVNTCPFWGLFSATWFPFRIFVGVSLLDVPPCPALQGCLGLPNARGYVCLLGRTRVPEKLPSGWVTVLLAWAQC